VFVFPTIQDGFAVVLAQAQAAGLPLLATTNCAGPDLIREGETGWVLPIRAPEAFAERLRRADAHREALAEVARRVYEDYTPRAWADVAVEFVALCRGWLAGAEAPAEAAG
jgi:glycosyltransferase involved in cell wall biosynthesis